MEPLQADSSFCAMEKLYDDDMIEQKGKVLSGQALWEKRVADLATDTILLPDGRSLAYHVDGELALGRPVILLLHGMFSSRLCFVPPRRPSRWALVAVDRPGWGASSDPPKDYSYMSFARDIEALMDHLRVDRFSVIGHSSGGPNALAVAALLGPQRVPVTACLSGDTEYRNASPETPIDPMSHDFFCCFANCFQGLWMNGVVPLCTRWYPAILSLLSSIMVWFAGTFTRICVKSQLLRQESELLKEEGSGGNFFMSALVDSTRIGCKPSVARRGGMGFCLDFELERFLFDFKPDCVRSKVLFWAGEFDHEFLGTTLFNHQVLYPGSELHVVPNRGHLGVLASDTIERLIERVLQAGLKEV